MGCLDWSAVIVVVISCHVQVMPEKEKGEKNVLVDPGVVSPV